MSTARHQPAYSMTDVENNLVGLDYAQVEKRLDLLADDLRLNVIRAGLRAGMKPVREVMESRVPTRKGYLKSGIGTKLEIDKKAGDGFGVVGPFRKVTDASGKKRSQSYKAGWIEYGTAHMKAQPFIKPSLQARERDIPPAFMTAIDKAIRKHGL
ncbi:HK97-gp10 family putative phage morphogenesis protein [Endozoicomonas acroporae]|uniref:HK97-gp10 family putative phage morphogenesis protein n=1 Tax=Endozoicomonas acroporae TaxID=1701104 RepID=UPI0013D7774E|nr:HK97-gp10 family putative phage morphogenesis protein [Endozoicomonas acroporae]